MAARELAYRCKTARQLLLADDTVDEVLAVDDAIVVPPEARGSRIDHRHTRRLLHPERPGRFLLVEMGASVAQGEDGQPQRLRIEWRDVTDQRSLEGQLLQAQKLEGIGRLAGGVAHDFNNMLTVIVSTASMANMSVPDGSPLADDLEQIEMAAHRGAELTRGLLAFSRKTVLEPRPTTFVTVADNAQKLLRRLLGENIRFETKHAPDPWCVLVDVAQFEQIVVNLAINGRDAMPDGGTLTLETANVVLDESYAASHLNIAPGSYAVLSVSDTGTGMTREVRERAFEPFFTTKPPGRGTGLGLAVCYGIVQQAGGSVWLYSEPGHGTTVKIYVPRSTEGSQPSVADLQARDDAGGTETILVAEDDARVRALTVRILSSAGYRVLEATNGKHALDLATAHPGKIDLVVTDVMMPELGGRQRVEALRQRAIIDKALFVSGYTENSIVHQGVLDSGIEFLAKSLGPTTLLARVRLLLSRPRAQ